MLLTSKKFIIKCNEFQHFLDSLDDEYRDTLCNHELIKDALKPYLKEGERYMYITGFPNYVVTDFGNVYSIMFKASKNINVKLLQPIKTRSHNSNSISDYKRLRVTLVNKNTNIKKIISIHKLVANAFLEAPDKSIIDPVIDHIDHDTTNNHYTNLRWISRAENSSNKLGYNSHPEFFDKSIDELLSIRDAIRDKQGCRCSDYNAINSLIARKRAKLK